MLLDGVFVDPLEWFDKKWIDDHIEAKLSAKPSSERLADWYARARRDLPWRRTRDPYRIWLSETMLQQTRVDTVVPYYERFVARFPTLDALAVADEEDVLRLWAGLGYYARARNLQRAAAAVARDHGGELPREAEALASLPGVGRYTVGALRSIAFGERAALVDGNVRRVLARLAGRARARGRPTRGGSPRRWCPRRSRATGTRR